MLLKKKSKVITERKERKTYEPLSLSAYKRRKNNDGSASYKEPAEEQKSYPLRKEKKKIQPEIIGKFDSKMDNNQ